MKTLKLRDRLLALVVVLAGVLVGGSLAAIAQSYASYYDKGRSGSITMLRGNPDSSESLHASTYSIGARE